MSDNYCVQAKGDAVKPCQTSSDHFMHPNGDVGRQRPMSENSYVQDLVEAGRPSPMLADNFSSKKVRGAGNARLRLRIV